MSHVPPLTALIVGHTIRHPLSILFIKKYQDSSAVSINGIILFMIQAGLIVCHNHFQVIKVHGDIVVDYRGVPYYFSISLRDCPNLPSQILSWKSCYFRLTNLTTTPQYLEKEEKDAIIELLDLHWESEDKWLKGSLENPMMMTWSNFTFLNGHLMGIKKQGYPRYRAHIPEKVFYLTPTVVNLISHSFPHLRILEITLNNLPIMDEESSNEFTHQLSHMNTISSLVYLDINFTGCSNEHQNKNMGVFMNRFLSGLTRLRVLKLRFLIPTKLHLDHSTMSSLTQLGSLFIKNLIITGFNIIYNLSLYNLFLIIK